MQFQKEIDPSINEQQVGKSLGVVDANIAPEKDLLTFPYMTPAIVKGIVEKRPFNSVTDLNAYLLSQGLKPEQAMEFYTKTFVHINLNTASRDEILLVPGAGNRMAREFAEYRPWKPGRSSIKRSASTSDRRQPTS